MVEYIKRQDVDKVIEDRLARHQAGQNLIDKDGEDPLKLKGIIPLRIKELIAVRTEISRIPSVTEEQ
jgi:hypothetical protein